MRLLISIHDLSSGGAERVTANLANYWAAKGWDVTVVTLAPRSQDFYELHPAVRRVALELTGISGNVLVGLVQNLHRVIAQRRVLREVMPDIALSMMTVANVQMALAPWGLPNIRAVGSERSYPPQCPFLSAAPVWNVLRRCTYGRLAAVTALTRECADWIKACTGARRVPVIPNVATWPLPVHTPTIIPERLCHPARQVLLAVGRFSKEKQYGMLLGVFHSLAGQHPDWDLVILGEGPQHPELQDQVLARGLENRVFLPGRTGNVGQWYERADLFVMTSRFEGFPNSLAEAMAHGLPAVSFDCDTGPRDIIRHEMDGLLVPPGDVAALAAALDRLMGDTTLRQRFAERAVEARERFSMERIAGMWEELFEEVMT